MTAGTDVGASGATVWSEVDLGAVRANVRSLAAWVAPAQVLAVVKANGYGHGAVPVARAALEAGATLLGVARVHEGLELREAGITAPILLLSEVHGDATHTALAHDLTPIVYSVDGVEAIEAAVPSGAGPVDVHLKVDTGMHRVGCRPEDAGELAARVAASPALRLGGICTHLAVADAVDADGRAYTEEQLARFASVLDDVRERGVDPGLVHAANSAAALSFAAARHDVVRIGIALYGIEPVALPDGVRLRPAMSLRSRVTMVKRLRAGTRVSYGLRYELSDDAYVATVPAGYADGVPRNLGASGGEVLIRGRRFPIAGVVTMDQLMVDVGDEPVEAGDEVVLIGAQGDHEITAADWARRLGTIPYEIVTGIGSRVPRSHRG